MFSQFLDRLVNVDVGRLWAMITGALADPRGNILVFSLVIGGITLVVLLLVLVVVLIFAGSDEPDEIVLVKARPTKVVPAAGATDAGGEFGEIQRAEVVRQRSVPVLTNTVWLLLAVAVWVAGGYVSARDPICVSCHAAGTIHALRFENPGDDPHAKTQCVRCHESSSLLEVVTVAVPGRAAHMLGAVYRQSLGVGYGVPVANSACARCHKDALKDVTTNKTRGVRMSHAEPLEARARCTDCHAADATAGAVGASSVGMDPCLRCHDNEIATAECKECHTKDFGYAVRTTVAFQPRAQVADIQCGGCHSQKACDECHGTRMPHTRAFMAAGHAREAVIDVWFNNGRVCSRCHTENRMPCKKCHLGSFPSHPVKDWIGTHATANPYGNACDRCHANQAWMVGRNFCGLCHFKYQPSIYPDAESETTSIQRSME